MYDKIAEDIYYATMEKLARAYNELVLPEARSYMAKSLQNIRKKYPMRPSKQNPGSSISELRNFSRTGLTNVAKGIQEDLGYIPPASEQPSLIRQYLDGSREVSTINRLKDAYKSLENTFAPDPYAKPVKSEKPSGGVFL